jgi:hypothetical protein
MFTRLRYQLSTLRCRLGFGLNGTLYLFPRGFTLDIGQLPTYEEFKQAGGSAYIHAQLRFAHGWPWSPTETALGVFRPVLMFQPGFWRWSGSGQHTPGFLVEELECQAHLRRQATEAMMSQLTRQG